jgi:hypothetical protein
MASGVTTRWFVEVFGWLSHSALVISSTAMAGSVLVVLKGLIAPVKEEV